MNLNDLRKNAYKKSDLLSAVQKFEPEAVSVKKSVDSLPSQQLLQAEQNLISGGLVKVPLSKNESDGEDSVFRRVAKFLLLVGVDEAAKILPHLSESQTEKIIPEIASIRKISPEEAASILKEFQGLMEQSRHSGGLDVAREILEKAYGTQKAEELLDRAAPFSCGKPFEYLNDVDAERIFALLSDESAAVRVLVLSRLAPAKAAAVINLMKPQDKKEVVFRLAKMEPVSPDVLKRADKALREKSLSQTSEKAENLDGRNALAEILKRMPFESENSILNILENDDPSLGEDLRSRLFTIDDVLKSDERFIQKTLHSMSDMDVALLIAGKPDEFRKKILDCVSQGRKYQITYEEDVRKPLHKSECQRVTSNFFSVLRKAYEQGRLLVDGRNDEEYV